VVYNGRGFFCCGIQRRTISGWQKKIFPLYPTHKSFSSVVTYTTTESFYAVYCIPLRRRFFCTVSHIGERHFLHNKYITEELWDATQKNLAHCIPQRRWFSSNVSHNERDFPLLWDITEKVFYVVGYNGRGFPPLRNTTEEVFSVMGYNGEK
jgi:hypothetical protein